MMSLITAIVISLLLGCNGDVSESRNHRLPLSSLATIPSPPQSLLPPTFENPIKDYTVGLVPPPVQSQTLNTVTEPSHQHHHEQASGRQQLTHHATGLITPPLPSRTIVQHHNEYPIGSVRTPIHHQSYHSTNPVQPQVYQPKTVVYQQYQQKSTQHHHHHHHQQQPQAYSYGSGFAIPRVDKQQSYHSVATPVQYYAPVAQSAVHQHSAHAHYTSVDRSPSSVEHVHPSAQQSSIVSRPVSSSGVRLIQTYPSVSYAAQHGSTLNLGNAKLEPELAYIISEVLGRYHF